MVDGRLGCTSLTVLRVSGLQPVPAAGSIAFEFIEIQVHLGHSIEHRNFRRLARSSGTVPAVVPTMANGNGGTSRSDSAGG